MSENVPPSAGRLPVSVIARIVLAALIVSAINVFIGYCWLETARSHSSAGQHFGLAVLTAGPLLALFGLMRRTSWGRWFALGTALAGITVLGASTIVNGLRVLNTWTVLVAIGLGVLTLCLVGRTMSEQFEFRADSRGAWRGVRRERQARLLNLVPIMSLSAVPALLILLLGLGPGHATLRSLLAAAALACTAGGVALLLAQRTVGMLLLIVSGAIAGALAVTCFSAGHLYFFSSVVWTVGYALLPAVLGGVLAIVALARPMARALRG